MSDNKTMIIICLTIVATVFVLLFASSNLETRDMVKAHHDYVRRVELQLADLRARLEILENIGVQIDVVGHAPVYEVTEVEVNP